MSHVYHLLTESESFSEHSGGAISRWTANTVRYDKEVTVLAPSADDSWGLDPARVVAIVGLPGYKSFIDRGGWHLPWSLRFAMLRQIFTDPLRNLAAGDVVWVHNRPEVAAALDPIVRRRDARLVLHLHNSHLVQWSEKVIRAVHADCYVFCSRFLEQEALNKFPLLLRTRVLRSGADSQLFYPATEPGDPAGTPVVLFAARLVPDKGLHIFLDAMRELQHQGVRLRGRVVGSATFGADDTTNYVREMQSKAPDNVSFEPYCSGPELAAIFRESDIFCLPACWNEPLGLAPIEAMASGLPVVATRSGGIPETLAHGGGIVVAKNSVAELRDALAILANNHALRRDLSAQAYASFQRNFTWGIVRDKYHRILEEVAANQVVVETAQQDCTC